MTSPSCRISERKLREIPVSGHPLEYERIIFLQILILVYPLLPLYLDRVFMQISSVLRLPLRLTADSLLEA